MTTLGGPLCSTLLVAESLEIIAHTCRALAKLSDSNTTIQVHTRDDDGGQHGARKFLGCVVL